MAALLVAAASVVGGGACGSRSLMETGGGGTSGGTIGTGSGATGGSVGRGGTGVGAFGGGPAGSGGGERCDLDTPRTLVACGVFGGISLALPPNGQAVASFLETWNVQVEHWDNITGAWRRLPDLPIRRDEGSPPVLRVDSQGRPIIAFLGQGDDRSPQLVVQRWDGTAWASLANGLSASGGEGAGGFDMEIDGLDRPVLLLLTPGGSGSQISVLRREGDTWARTGGAASINTAPAWTARLAIDGADRITPHVAYVPTTSDNELVTVRLDAGAGWTARPALVRGVFAGFDIAAWGTVVTLAYLDGPSLEDARVFVSQNDGTAWSAPVALNADTNLPVRATRVLATGGGPADLVVAYSEYSPIFTKTRVSLKQAPDWSVVPGAVPQSGGSNIAEFDIAAEGRRLAIGWHAFEPTYFVGYHELVR